MEIDSLFFQVLQGNLKNKTGKRSSFSFLPSFLPFSFFFFLSFPFSLSFSLPSLFFYLSDTILVSATFRQKGCSGKMMTLT
jgi:hypothetical protein